MGVSVNQRRCTSGAHGFSDRSGVDVHDLSRLICIGLHALSSHLFAELLAFGQGFFHQILLPCIAAQQFSHILISLIIGAEEISVAEQNVVIENKRVVQ